MTVTHRHRDVQCCSHCSGFYAPDTSDAEWRFVYCSGLCEQTAEREFQAAFRESRLLVPAPARRVWGASAYWWGWCVGCSVAGGLLGYAGAVLPALAAATSAVVFWGLAQKERNAARGDDARGARVRRGQ